MYKHNIWVQWLERMGEDWKDLIILLHFAAVQLFPDGDETVTWTSPDSLKKLGHCERFPEGRNWATQERPGPVGAQGLHRLLPEWDWKGEKCVCVRVGLSGITCLVVFCVTYVVYIYIFSFFPHGITLAHFFIGMTQRCHPNDTFSLVLFFPFFVLV